MRFLKISFLIFALIVGLCFLGYQVLFHRPLQERTQLIANLAAKGWPTEVADLIPEPIPDENNAAMYYREAWEMLDRIEYKGQNYHDLLMAYRNPDADTEAKILFWEMCQSPDVSAVLDKIRYATERELCQFEVQIRANGSIWFPDLSKMMGLSSFLNNFLECQCFHRLTEEAFETLSLQFRVARDMQQLPMAIGMLVQISGNRMFSNGSQLYVSAFPEDLQAQEQLAKWLPQLRNPSLLSESMGTELVEIRRYVESNNKMDTFDEVYEGSDDFWIRWRCFLGHLLATPRDINFLIEGYQIQADAFEKPYQPASIATLEKQMDEIPGLFLVSRELLPMNLKLYAKHETDRMTLRLMETALRLLEIQKETGPFPETLTGFSALLVLDSFSGEPFVYQKNEKGFLLYSVGENGKDEGGIRLPVGSRIDDLSWEFPTRRLDDLR